MVTTLHDYNTLSYITTSLHIAGFHGTVLDPFAYYTAPTLAPTQEASTPGRQSTTSIAILSSVILAAIAVLVALIIFWRRRAAARVAARAITGPFVGLIPDDV